MLDCIFCKIVEGQAPAYKLYEDDNTISFLDVYPGVKGHTLVIPKKHFENIFEIPEEVYLSVMQTTHKLASILKESLGCDGLTCTQLNGKASGQTVFHLHFHLLPRWYDDGVIKIWKPLNKEREDFVKLQEQILKKVR